VRKAGIREQGTQTTVFSILLFTETEQRSGFFLKKKPPCTLSQCQHVNRKRSRRSLGTILLPNDLAAGLAAWKQQAPDSSPDAFIFPNQDGGFLDTDNDCNTGSEKGNGEGPTGCAAAFPHGDHGRCLHAGDSGQCAGGPFDSPRAEGEVQAFGGRRKEIPGEPRKARCDSSERRSCICLNCGEYTSPHRTSWPSKPRT
jgi:hypothetical protein